MDELKKPASSETQVKPEGELSEEELTQVAGGATFTVTVTPVNDPPRITVVGSFRNTKP